MTFPNHLSQFAGNPPQGTVTGVTLSQSGYFGINVTWGYEPALEDPQDVSFGIYLNGRLKQVQPGNVRATTIIAPNETTHEVDVIVWPSAYDMPDTYYTSFATRRAHLNWDASTAADIAAYVIYHSLTSDGTFTEYATQETVEVDGASFDFTSGATVIISGAPGDEYPEYHNCTFTVTVTDDVMQTATVTNSVDAESITITYAVGQPLTILEGISIVITEPPETNDTLDFPVRIATYYDTNPLDEGTHYFKIKARDRAGNLSDFSNEIAVTISLPPLPVSDFAVGYDRTTDAVTYTVTQSPDGALVRIYSNYNPDTNTLIDEVYYEAPLALIPLAADQTTTGTILSDAPSKPDGEYIFVARSVSAAGVESDDTTADTITLPYLADEPNIISAEVTQNGDTFTVTVVSDGIPSTNEWILNWDPFVGGDGGQWLLSDPTPGEGSTYVFTATLSVSGNIYSDETTFTLRVNTVTFHTFTYTFDTTPPDAPGNATGVAY